MKCREPETPQERLAWAIAEIASQSRLDSRGGYPDDWVLYGDVIVIASVTYEDAPELTIESVPFYIAANDYWIEEYDEHEELRQLYKQCLSDPAFRRAINAARRLMKKHTDERRIKEAEWRARLSEERKSNGN